MIAGAKRGKNEHKGLHSWHPYYAGFSESFVASVLQIEEAGPQSVVFDPWMGSGTTGIVCQKNNVNCIGADINPVMSYFAASKNKENISVLDNSGEELLRDITLGFNKIKNKINSLSGGVSVIEQLQWFYQSISEQFNNKMSLYEVNPIKAFFCSVLFNTIRNTFDVKQGSNPTWISKKLTINNIGFDLCLEYRKNYEKMSGQLRDFYSNSYSNANCTIFNVDSKKMMIDDSSIDLVISSPPYLTRIDYAVSTRLELEIVLGTDGYNSLRKRVMGTTTVPKFADAINPAWGALCLNVLSLVTSHNSIASSSYYLKNKIRYFYDAYNSMAEIYRVLKPGCSAYLVIQNSYYKEIEIPLYDIYCEMACSLGFSSSICVREDKVKTILGQINTKSKLYINDKHYFEKIIKVTK